MPHMILHDMQTEMGPTCNWGKQAASHAENICPGRKQLKVQMSLKVDCKMRG